MNSTHDGRVSILQGLRALTGREIKKWLKEPVMLIMIVLQPVIWMGLFGKAMNLNAVFSMSNINIPQGIYIPGSALIPPQEEGIMISGTIISQIFNNLGSEVIKNVFGVTDYFSYMAVGMVSMIVMFTTIFSGMSIVWDRRLGFLEKVLSTPVSRAAIILSKMLNAAIRAIFQATIVLGLAAVLGMKMSSTFTPLNLLGIYVAVFLLSMGLSSIFLALALRSTRQETQMAIVNLITMPLMFASNVFFPVSMMPAWIQVIARINPVSFVTDAIRQLTVLQLDLSALINDFAYLGMFAFVFCTIGILLSWRYLTK